MIKQREQKNHRRKKELAKKQIKIKEEKRIVKKHVESYNCKRCSKNCFVKFISNFKLYQHIRERHAKKFKSIEAIKSIVAIASFTSFSIVVESIASHSNEFVTTSSSFELVAKHASSTFSFLKFAIEQTTSITFSFNFSTTFTFSSSSRIS